jgi:hypothetical protein
MGKLTSLRKLSAHIKVGLSFEIRRHPKPYNSLRSGLEMPDLDRDANTFHSSGMCKAGFAGDDAPRAVFRKYPSTRYHSPATCMLSGSGNPYSILNSSNLLPVASIVGRPRHHG